jgi:hypothetical protein
VGQAEILLGQRGQVRSKNDRAGVPGPAAGLKPGVVLGQVRIAGIAEDLLDEVEVRDQRAGGEQADLAALGRVAGIAGTTSGRMSSDTKRCAGWALAAV